MGLKEWFSDTFVGTVTKGVDSLASTVDRFIQTGDEKAAFKLELKKFEIEMQKLQMQGENEYNKDRQNAREMYMKDSSLQKIFAIVFLVFYCLISMGMIAMIIAMAFFGKVVELPDWGIMIISSVFTGMSSKVATITDFLFGASKSKDDSDKETAAAFKESIKK